MRSASIIPLLFALSCAHVKAPTDLVPYVLRKAAFELACAADQLKVTELSDGSTQAIGGSIEQKAYGVEGCGKRVRYTAYCTHPMMMKEWCDAMQTSGLLAPNSQ